LYHKKSKKSIGERVMCKLKSAIVLKDRIFMPDYDSHSDMLNELGINDDYLGASKKFVRVELSPKDGNVFSDIDGWKLTVDQDIRPEWFSEEECKPKMIEAVKEWAKTHIHIGVDGLKIESGKNHYIKDCKNVEIKNSTVEACGNSTVKAWGNSTVEACGNSTVKAWDNSTVKAWDNSTVKACGNSTVKAWCNSTVEAWDNSTVKACGNSTVEACGNSTVKAWGNSTVKAWGNSTVEACGNSTVMNNPYWTWHTQNTLVLADNATFKDEIGEVIYQSGNYKLVAVESGKTIGG
jgi:hypothetical protein